ncbi:MAG: FAD-dependent oxidoreductase [Chromatiales bacterium]|jgi:2-oxoacid:acceptor oxidoreductase delta subunit (pyruvate/2-ketoisovalerate family)|nr:FAD-dependent oxidoreductase [Chromatiales bacterium]MDX9766463.1 FAD-dependent oxidoreductase [Ectothiorhodospiraceae bacterium]
MKTIPRGAFAEPGTSLAFHTGSWRVQKPVHDRRPAPCHAVCPAGEDPQTYLAKVEEGDLKGAWETLVAANPLPAITGRVCPHFCESACNRRHYDDAIAIHNVERFLGDEAIRQGWAYPLRPAGDGAPCVAVVGAGPAGLAAAWHLRRLGHAVTLFEAMPQAGGTLRTAIPQYRLPREAMDAELERLLAIGIEFRPHTRLGRDVSLAELRQDFSALFLGPGNQLGREWSADFAVPSDLRSGLQLLQEWIATGALPVEAKSVALLGGGNTAIDLSRVLRRSGVAEVHLITHQRAPAPGVPSDDVMRAAPSEVAMALEEGVIVHEHRGIRRLILRGERVIGVELVRMKKLTDDRGRLHRVAFEGTETVLHVDMVIPAIGQVVDGEGFESLLGTGSYFKVDAWTGLLRGQENVFVGGDARGDHGTVTEAVGDGRRAAMAIDRLLRGEAPPAPDTAEPVAYESLNLHYFEPEARAREPVLPVERRQGLDEIEQGLDANQVRHEAHRCFSCGDCLACDNCWTLCPDQSVLKTRDRASDGSHYVFDYDYCKGCGLCAHECPTGYIRMVEDL